MLVNISDIKVKKRVRKDLGDLDALKDSLRCYGLMNPITITKDYRLIAGERRLQAAKAIGWERINCNIVDGTTEIDQLEMEIEENNQRKEFTQQELLDGYKRLERLKHPNFIVKFFKAIFNFFKRIFKAIFRR